MSTLGTNWSFQVFADRSVRRGVRTDRSVTSRHCGEPGRNEFQKPDKVNYLEWWRKRAGWLYCTLAFALCRRYCTDRTKVTHSSNSIAICRTVEAVGSSETPVRIYQYTRFYKHDDPSHWVRSQKTITLTFKIVLQSTWRGQMGWGAGGGSARIRALSIYRPLSKDSDNCLLKVTVVAREFWLLRLHNLWGHAADSCVWTHTLLHRELLFQAIPIFPLFLQDSL